MIFNNKTVTLNNYKELFKGYSPDIQDEIRSAVMDDTDIMDVVESCRDDSYKLGQIRMARREGVEECYINPYFTGATISYIRKARQIDIDISAILVYVNKQGIYLPPMVVEELAKAVIKNIPINKVDFRKVPYTLVSGFLRGLQQGYPMWLLVDDVEGCRYSEERLNILIRGMHLGVDVHPFLQGNWTDEQIMFLLSGGSKVNGLLGMINSNFSLLVLHELMPLFLKGVDVSPLCVTEGKNGVPVYNSYQIYELGEAMLSGFATPDMFNSNLSDVEMEQMRLRNAKK